MLKSIMLVGVGGQGTLLASRILGNVIRQADYDVKVSEVHGMSQRGGSVVTYVKYGEEVNSPVVEKGEADVIVSFEQLEAARWISYLKQGGSMITNNQKISPMPVIMGAAAYPNDITEKIKSKEINITEINALSLAKEAGNTKAVNVVLMGVLSQMLDFKPEYWEKALIECVPAKLLEVNQKAFLLGKNIVR